MKREDKEFIKMLGVTFTFLVSLMVAIIVLVSTGHKDIAKILGGNPGPAIGVFVLGFAIDVLRAIRRQSRHRNS